MAQRKFGEKNSQFGTCWIYSRELNLEKKIKKSEALEKGWQYGRITTKLVKAKAKRYVKECKCRTCNKNFVVTKYASGTFCSQKCNPSTGGLREGSGHSKSGWYKGIFCNSTWELAFLLWCLDNKIPIKRFEDKPREYASGNKIRKYYPDFVVGDIECIVEIKGYTTLESTAKQNANDDVLLLTKNELRPILQYAKERYGNYIELFEGNPHNNKKNLCKICGEPCKRILCSRKCSGIYVSNLVHSSNG